MGERIYVSMPLSLVAEVESRVGQKSRSDVVSRDLDRLYSLYRRAIGSLDLTVQEASLILDVLNGSLYDVVTAPMLWAAVEDRIKYDSLDEKWGVDGPALVEKLKALTDVQALALVDIGERFWYGDQKYKDLPFDEAVKELFKIKTQKARD